MPRTRTRTTRLFLVLLALAAVAAAAGLILHASAAGAASGAPTPALSSAGSAPPGGETTLKIGQLQTPDNLNPFLGLQGLDYQIWHLNYDFLVGFNAGDLKPRPELAISWTHSADGKKWTFHTRQGVKWQDGVPFTAADVAFTFNYIVKNNLSNLAVYTDGITGAKATGPNTVEVTTKAPKANMLRMVVPILPEHVWAKISGKAAGSSFQNPAPIVGTGPYQVVEFQPSKFVHLRANPDYWGTKPAVTDLYIMVYTNADTMTQDLKTGAIDAAVDIPVAQFAPLSHTAGITVNKGTSWQFTELGMNCYDSPDSKGNPVLLDQQFRQALEWAVDRNAVVATAFSGYATPGNSLIVPYSPYHWEPSADQAFSYNPDKAKQILDAAGYKDVNGDGLRETKQGKPLSLRLFVANDSQSNVTTGKLCVQWFKDVGVKVVLKVVDTGTLTNAQYAFAGNTFTPDYDLFIWYWTQDVDPQFMISIYTPPQSTGYGWNDCLWTDPAYTKVSDAQATTIDEAQRIPLVQQAQQLFYEASPYIIFTYPQQLEAWNSDKWTGWTKAPADVGAAIYNYNNIDTYVNVKPNTGSTSSSSSSSTLWIAVVAIVVVVAAIIIIMALRRRGRTVEE